MLIRICFSVHAKVPVTLDFCCALVFLDVFAFVMLTALRACNNWEKAEEILSMMKSRAIKPNEVTYTELISICGRSGDVHQALVSNQANPLNTTHPKDEKSAYGCSLTHVFSIFGTSFLELYLICFFPRVQQLIETAVP